MSNVLNKRFADKVEVINQLKMLTSKIKTLKSKMQVNTSNTSDSDEAILTKRQMGQYCASCDKEVVNLRSDSVGFTTWDKFPQRDLSSRTKGHMKSILRKGEKDDEEVKVQDNSLPKIFTKPH